MTLRRFLFLACAVACTGLVGCSKQEPRDLPKPSSESTPRITKPVPQFSGTAAFEYLLAQTKFGPRNPGSAGHANCLDYLKGEFRRLADAVILQEFSHTGYRGEQIRLTNIISSFNLRATNRLLFAAHWDTRPFADQDADPKKRQLPILGANDGASGVAVLLQLARILKENPPSIGVDIVLFDGEDLGRSNDYDNFLLGSKYFAKNKAPAFNPTYGILLDMIGDSQLEIRKEKNSLRYAPEIVRHVWSVAEAFGLREFSTEEGPEVYDDHVPLNEAGIRTIDLIDFHYPDQSNRYWHTTEDTPDKCSPRSLEAVGTLLTHLIYGRAL
jgi:glutaminyl-peptide cyclotransferase